VQRMQDMAAGKLPHARPLLLFPEGTTTNGRFLLPFKTGAFLAGLPLQPVVIQYGEVRGGEGWDECSGYNRWPSGHASFCSHIWAWLHCVARRLARAQPSALADLLAAPSDLQGRFSPSWEMIPAARHIFLIMANPVRTAGVAASGVGFYPSSCCGLVMCIC